MQENQLLFGLFSQETTLLNEIRSNPNKRYTTRKPRIWVSLDYQGQGKPMLIRKDMTTTNHGRDVPRVAKNPAPRSCKTENFVSLRVSFARNRTEGTKRVRSAFKVQLSF